MNKKDKHRHNVVSHLVLSEVEVRDIDGRKATVIDNKTGGYVRLATAPDGLELQVYSAPDDRATKVLLDKDALLKLIDRLQDRVNDWDDWGK